MKTEQKMRQADPVGYPDFTKPITIAGITIVSLPIDIVAQTIGNIAVNIAACAMTLNVKTAPGEKVEVGIVSAIQVNVNIAASAITLDVHETGTANVAITSSVQLNVNIAASAITLNVHETGTANVAITSSITLNMNITGSTINVPVVNPAGQSLNVGITSSVTLNISITGSTITVPIETKAGEKVDVNIITSVTLNVAIQSSAVTLNVNIQSQTVDINIKTSGGANIIIDKLTQAAITERRASLENYSTVEAYEAITGNNRRGKFFPRGCRGFLTYLWCICKDVGASGGTITFYLAPTPGMGPVMSGTITVAAGGGAEWRIFAVNRMWNYDSLFVWWVCSTADIQVGYDTGTPYDGWQSADAGVNWSSLDRRYTVLLFCFAQTIGDLPVSGTINTIEIPSISAVRQNVGLNVGAMSQVFDTLQAGTGETLIIIFHASGANVGQYLCPLIRCDGADVIPVIYSFVSWNDYLISASTPGIALGKYDTANLRYCIVVTVPYPFKRSLEIGYNNVHPTATLTGYVSYSYKKIT